MTARATITSQKAKLELFQKQFESTTVVLAQATQQILCMAYKQFNDLKLPLYNVREILVEARINVEIYNKFYNVMKQQFPFLEDLIEFIVITKIEFLRLEDLVKKNEFGTYVKEPIHLLWIFLLRLFFEKPRLLLDKTDDRDGTNTKFVRDGLSDFIAECINIQFRSGPTLTALSLKTLSDMDERSEAGDSTISAPMKQQGKIKINF